MRKQIYSRQAKSKDFKRSGIVSHSDLKDPRIRRALPRRTDYKRTIERFFRPQSFPQRAAKKRSKEETKRVPKLSDLMALFEKAQRQINDQIKDHKMACRNRRTDHK